METFWQNAVAIEAVGSVLGVLHHYAGGVEFVAYLVRHCPVLLRLGSLPDVENQIHCLSERVVLAGVALRELTLYAQYVEEEGAKGCLEQVYVLGCQRGVTIFHGVYNAHGIEELGYYFRRVEVVVHGLVELSLRLSKWRSASYSFSSPFSAD